MENTKPLHGFNTGICESTHSKLTMVSAISDLKKLLSEKVYIFRDKTMEQVLFSDVVNQDGCIHLKGVEIQGHSLYDYYEEYFSDRYFSEETQKIIDFVDKILKTSEALREATGSYPYLMLNSIYITSNGRKITYLPPSIVDYINKHRTAEVQHLLYYCTTLKKARVKGKKVPPIEMRRGDTPVEPFDFARAVARFLYLFLLKKVSQVKPGGIPGPGMSSESLIQPVLYLKEYVRDVPPLLADAVWNLMHDRGVGTGTVNKALSDLGEIVGRCRTLEKPDELPEKIPLSRRSSFIIIRSSILTFLSRRWKYILTGIVAVLLLFYLLSDLFVGREKREYLRGLSPRQVVELYYGAINELDLNALDAVFYRRAGKEIRNELATITVMMRMEQAFGRRLIPPDQLGEMQSLPEDYTVFGIDDLNIKQVSDDENPVFFATYIRVISSEGTLHRYPVEETIYLKKINDYWYITESFRKVKEEEE